MIKGLINEQLLKLKLKTGFSSAIVVWAVVTLMSAAIAGVFFLVAAFVWLSLRYGQVTAALILAGFFLALAIISMLALVLTRNRTIDRTRAQLTLAATARQHSAVSWMDPKMLAIGVQVLTVIGLKRIVPIAAAGFLAASLGKEWARYQGRDKDPKAPEA